MRFPKLSPQAHWVLLILFALGMFGLILLPMLLMGYPYGMPETIKSARVLQETGLVIDNRQHMLMMILVLIHPLVSWTNANGWMMVGAAAFCLSFFPLWWSIKMLFDETSAWISTIIFSLLPLSWLVGQSMGGYNFALLPFFLCFATFITFHEKRPMLAIVLSAIFFGITISTQHSYIAFLPWFVVAYLWHWRKAWKPALVRTGVFCVIAYSMFLVPMLPNALQPGLTPTQRVEELFSPMQQKTPAEGHLYPDEFLFEHYREEYNEVIESRAAESSFIKRQEDKNYRITFGTGDFNILDRLSSGTWLFLNSFPDFLYVDFVGGAFLWLFLLPGIIFAYKKNRLLVLYIGGLILSMEFFLRYVLLFVSSHLGNYLWAIALFGGVGAAGIITTLAQSWKLKPNKKTLLTIFVACIIGMQLLQANRKQMARMYARSDTPEILAATEVLKDIPEDAVVAGPRRDDLFILSDRNYVSVHPLSIEFFSERGKLAEPFTMQGVTHIIGYDEDQVRAIKRVVPRVKVIDIPVESFTPELSPFIRYLLHTVR